MLGIIVSYRALQSLCWSELVINLVPSSVQLTTRGHRNTLSSEHLHGYRLIFTVLVSVLQVGSSLDVVNYSFSVQRRKKKIKVQIRLKLKSPPLWSNLCWNLSLHKEGWIKCLPIRVIWIQQLKEIRSATTTCSVFVDELSPFFSAAGTRF